jgi:hypothetical protein
MMNATADPPHGKKTRRAGDGGSAKSRFMVFSF